MSDPSPEPLPGRDASEVPLSVQLRQETAPAHRRLDHQPVLACLVGNELTLDRYRDSLLALARVWVPLERWLDQALMASRDDASPFFLPRRQSLLRDLAMLADGHSHLPAGRWMPVPDGLDAGSPAHRVGCLYVLSGAQMGAVLLERSVAAALPDAPRHFLTTRFEDAGPRWLQFRHFLDHRFPLASDQSTAIDAANLTFEAFLSALEHPARPSSL
ncbi:biliverdin-producing heme oxygenase [Marinobacter sp. C2H3]|uniref:biliverdin-producing heme oxygenase n=1 Tax=Marinobacter sp. C2H3 TaxID=3119003 RepID=UPI00300ED4AC